MGNNGQKGQGEKLGGSLLLALFIERVCTQLEIVWCPLFINALCVSCVHCSDFLTEYHSPSCHSVSMPLCGYTGMCSAFTPAPYHALSLSLCLLLQSPQGLGAVGFCSQSAHYSAFSSRSTCPSLCVSTACLNYSHPDHYWEHSPPPSYDLPPPSLKNPSG